MNNADFTRMPAAWLPRAREVGAFPGHVGPKIMRNHANMLENAKENHGKSWENTHFYAFLIGT